MSDRSRRPAHPFRAGLTAAAVLLLLLLWPVVVLAHASLVTSDPADGTTLTAPPVTITATYAEAFDTARSSMALLGPDGATLATSERIDAATADSMTISGYGTLGAGTYKVQWTTITPDDNGIERGTFTFTLASAAGSPSASALAASASPGGAPSGSPGSSGAAPSASPSATPAVSATVAPGATAAATPAAAATPGAAPSGGAGDIVLPLVALVALVGVGLAWFVRRSR